MVWLAGELDDASLCVAEHQDGELRHVANVRCDVPEPALDVSVAVLQEALLVAILLDEYLAVHSWRTLALDECLHDSLILEHSCLDVAGGPVEWLDLLHRSAKGDVDCLHVQVSVFSRSRHLLF